MKFLTFAILITATISAPLSHAASYSEALTHLKTNKLDQAIISIDQAIEKEDSAASRELKGRILTKLNQSVLAMEQFKLATELEPKRGATHFFIGEVFFKEERWTEALRAYRFSLELDPENKSPILKIVYCLIIMENYPAAHQWITTLDPTNDLKPDYYFARAAMSYATDMPEEYIAALRQARTIYSTQVFNRYEPDLLRVVQQLKRRKQSQQPQAENPTS